MVDSLGGVRDLPSDLSVAIDQAIRIDSWYEHLTKDEQPPQWMWTLEWELEEWFKGVEAAREAKYNNPDSISDKELDVPSMSNEYAERFKK